MNTDSTLHKPAPTPPATTRRARITGPVAYVAASGGKRHIPLGPCLVEWLDDRLIDIVWGATGQRSAVLPVQALAAARDSGNLVLLD